MRPEADPTLFARPPKVFEHDSITSAARLLGYDGNELADLSRQRADAGGSNVQDRNFPWEATEEAADGANYIVWELARLRDRALENPEQGQEELAYALAHFAAAFEHLRRYRSMLD